MVCLREDDHDVLGVLVVVGGKREGVGLTRSRLIPFPSNPGAPMKTERTVLHTYSLPRGEVMRDHEPHHKSQKVVSGKLLIGFVDNFHTKRDPR